MSINMQLEQIQTQLSGVSLNELQTLFDNSVKQHGNILFFLDASYMYTFHLDDFEDVRKFNILGRYEPKVNPEWHRMLERWYQDQTVTLGARTIKPIQIVRSIDRVVNEGMEAIAGAICGEVGISAFDCRGIGDGTVDEPSLSDDDLDNLIDIINVNTSPEGGSLSRDGTTIYSVGNHSKEVETPANNEFTECGMYDDLVASKRKFFDHSIFDDPLEHTQGVDAPGSTTVVYMCSG